MYTLKKKEKNGDFFEFFCAPNTKRTNGKNAKASNKYAFLSKGFLFWRRVLCLCVCLFFLSFFVSFFVGHQNSQVGKDDDDDDQNVEFT